MKLHFCEAIEIKDLTGKQQNEKENKIGLLFEREIYKNFKGKLYKK